MKINANYGFYSWGTFIGVMMFAPFWLALLTAVLSLAGTHALEWSINWVTKPRRKAS